MLPVPHFLNVETNKKRSKSRLFGGRGRESMSLHFSAAVLDLANGLVPGTAFGEVVSVLHHSTQLGEILIIYIYMYGHFNCGEQIDQPGG